MAQIGINTLHGEIPQGAGHDQSDAGLPVRERQHGDHPPVETLRQAPDTLPTIIDGKQPVLEQLVANQPKAQQAQEQGQP